MNILYLKLDLAQSSISQRIEICRYFFLIVLKLRVKNNLNQFKNNQEKTAANLDSLASSCVHFCLRSHKPFERCGFLVPAKSSVNCCANYLSRHYQFRTCHQCCSASIESGTRLLWLQTWNLRSWSDMNFKLSMTLNQNFRGQFHCVRTRWQGIRSCARLGGCIGRHRSTLRNPPQVKVLKSYLYNFFTHYSPWASD